MCDTTDTGMDHWYNNVNHKITPKLYRVIIHAIKNYPDFIKNYGYKSSGFVDVDDPEQLKTLSRWLLEVCPYLIYTKSFAQAFWFDDDAGILMVSYFPPEEGHPIQEKWKHWQYHQVRLILADDPLEYLEGFMNY